MLKTYIHIILLCFFIPSGLIAQKHKRIDSLKAALKITKTDTGRIQILNDLSYEYLIYDVDSSLYYNNLAYEKASEIEYTLGIGISESNYASISEIEGDYQTAVEKYHTALEIFKDVNDSLGIIQTKANLALTHYYLNNSKNALKYGHAALHDARSFQKKDTGNIYNIIGLAYMSDEKYDTALYYFYQSKQISEEQGIRSGVAYSLGNIANVYMSRNEFQKALEIYFQVRAISEEQNNKIALSLSHVNISNAYTELADLKEDANEEKRYFELSVKHAEKALFYAKEMKSLIHVSYAYNQLMYSYKGTGEFDKAFEYAEKYIDSKDSLINLQKIKEIEKIETKYKLESIRKEKQLKEDIIKKQDQVIIIGSVAIFLVVLLLVFVFILYRRMKSANILLHQKNRAIENQRAEIAGQRDNLSELAFELKRTNKTKDKFFSVLAHDLKNPFQSIIGFAELLKAQADTGDASNMKQYAHIIYDTGKKTFSLLENLLNWARYQRGMIKFNPKNTYLSEIINDCIQLSKENANAKEITVTSEIDDRLQAYTDSFLVSTIIRNLLSNAVKFTKRGGKIKITAIENDNNTIDISVIDNGIGIKNDKIDKLFKMNVSSSQKGTEDEAGTGLGLLVCKEFAKKNKGDLNVISEENKGSTFTLTVLKTKPDA